MNPRSLFYREKITELLVFVFLVILYCAVVLPLFPTMLDDPFITFKYGRTLAEGGGLTWNPGEAPVEGYTSTLWMLMSSVSAKLSIYPILAAKVIGILSMLFFLVMIVWGCKRMMPALADRLFAGLLVVSSFDLVFYSVSAMENIVFTVLTFSLLPVLLRDARQPSSPNAVLLAVVSGILSWIRPEGHIVVIILFVYFMAGFKKNPQGIKRAVIFSAIVLGFILPLNIVRILYFKSIFPNTYYAKHCGGSFLQDAVTGLLYLSNRGVPYFCFLILYYLDFASRRDREAWVTATLVGIFFLYPVKVGGDDVAAFPGVRLILPVIPFIFVGAVCLIRRLLAGRQVLFITALLVVSFQISQVSIFFVSYKNLSQATNMTSSSVHRILQDAARHMKVLLHPEISAISRFLISETPAGESVALPFAGRIPYETRLNTIDLLGLNDRHIARQKKRQRGVDVKYDADYVLGKKPYFICEGFAMGQMEVSDLKKMGPADFYRFGAWKVGQRELLGHPEFQEAYEIDHRNLDPRITCFRLKPA